MKELNARPAAPPDARAASPDARRLRAQINDAERLRAAGKLFAAQKSLENLLGQIPPFFAAWSLLGHIHKDGGNPEAALNAFQRASMLDGRHGPTLVRQAEAYLALRAMDMAVHMLRAAETIDPEDPDLAFAWGQLHQFEQRFESARTAFEKALKLAPGRIEIALSLGELQVIIGDYDGAAKTLWEAWLAVRRKPSAAVTASHVLYSFAGHPRMIGHVDALREADAIERLVGKGDRPTAMRLAFIRGKAFESAGRFDEAWRAFQVANEIAWSNGASSDAASGRDREAFAIRDAAGCPVVAEQPFNEKAPLAIFVVGPSRSGKSSLERMIGAAFADVRLGYESVMVDDCIALTASRSGLPNLAHAQALPSSASRLLGETLSNEIAKRATGNRALTITHPGNIMHAGAIARAYSNAFFVFVRRDIEDNALRCYQRLYSAGHGYSYRLSECRRHFAWYYEMADAWMHRLPGRSMAVNYEDMVTDPNAVIRRIGEALHLSPARQIDAPPDDRGCAIPYRAQMTA